MTASLISCIIPAYNAERFIGEAVESVLAQTYRPLEIIIVDDGSTDRTAEVAGGFGEAVQYVHQANAGPGMARNTGIQRARGELVAFLDADDLWLPMKLDRQACEFQRRPELDALFTYVQNFWVDELQGEAERFRDHRISKPLAGYVAQTMMARKATFQRFGGFQRPAHGDVVEWTLQARDSGCTADILPEALTRRRIHQTNMSRTLQEESRDAFLHIIKAHLDRGRDR